MILQDKNFQRQATRIIAVLLFIYAAVMLYRIVAEQKQWDFKTYYYATVTYFSGQSPYEIESLSKAAGEEVLHPFVYLPPSFYFFKIFTLFPYQASFYLFLILKLALLTGLIIIWLKYFIDDKSQMIIFLLLCFFGYRETILRDLYTGNVSIIEQILIWSAAVFYLRSKYWVYCALIALSALFKGSSLLLLLIPLIDRNRHAVAAVIAGIGTFFLINYFAFIGRPGLFEGFIAVALSLDERGSHTPASLTIARDIGDFLRGPLGFDISFWLYGLFVAGIIIATALVLRKYDFRKNKVNYLMLCFLVYALISPRFKDYSYILLIVPAYYVLTKATQSNWVRLAVILTACLTFLDYQPYAVALILYILLLKYIWRNRADIDKKAADSGLAASPFGK